MAKHDNLVYLKHIVEACDKIADLVGRGGRELYDDDFAIGDAIVRELAVVGEAANNVSDEFKDSHQVVPWRKSIGMRNWLVHGYAEIDWNEVWDTAVNSVPDLKKETMGILEREGKK